MKSQIIGGGHLETFTITNVHSSITIEHQYIIKINRIVIATVHFITTASIPSWGNLFSIPSGACPVAMLGAPITNVSGGSTNVLSGRIFDTGNVQNIAALNANQNYAVMLSYSCI